MRLKLIKPILLVLVLLGGALVPPGCAVRQTASKPEKKLVIGLSMATLKEERWYIDRDDFISEAKRLGVRTICDVCYENSDTQYSQVRDMLAQGISVLVIIPNDAYKAADCVSLAKAAGVKVISYDRLVMNANVDLYVTFDSVKVGGLQAKAITQVKPRGNYVIVAGPTTDYNTVMLSRGIREVLNPYISRKEIKVVGDFSETDWMADHAAQDIRKLLQDSTKIDAVIAENDGLASGAITALAENHLIPAVPVVGMDADLSACQRIVEGQQLMTVYKPIKELAVRAADFAVDMAKGKSVKVPDRISDNKYDVPYSCIEPIAVTKDNMMSTVIKDGFHKTEEVYLNISKSSWPQP
ncbi:MAG: substrate-binding domain-containing protein [Clostridia bacterium]|nr:substrate-binding domain-containing protein [Clostridia bacterium]